MNSIFVELEFYKYKFNIYKLDYRSLNEEI